MSQTAAHNVAFIFDCDGTLVNSTPVWAYAQAELLHRHGVDVTVMTLPNLSTCRWRTSARPTTTRGALARMAKSCIASCARF